ncbi:MAG: hypothetical protein ACTS4W_00295 [Candidatus Hodgkinia cicadicola]
MAEVTLNLRTFAYHDCEDESVQSNGQLMNWTKRTNMWKHHYNTPFDWDYFRGKLKC